MKKTIIAVCLALSGCASFPQLTNPSQSVSYTAGEISPGNLEWIAQDMVQFLSTQLPPATTTIELEPSASLFKDILMEQLSDNGFGIVEADHKHAVPIRHFITILDGGVLVRLNYRDNVASRYYQYSQEGELSSASAYSVREATQ